MDEGWKGGRRRKKRGDERELTEGSGREVEGREEKIWKNGGDESRKREESWGYCRGSRVKVERVWKDTKEWEEQDRKRYRDTKGKNRMNEIK